MPKRLQYGRAELLSLYSKAMPSLCDVDRLRKHGLWRVCRLRCVRRHFQVSLCSIVAYRGCRAGLSKWRTPHSRSAGNGTSIIVGNRRRTWLKNKQCSTSRSSLLTVHVDRHSAPQAININKPVSVRATRSTAVIGCLNVRSLLCKFDDVVELCHDRSIDLLCLTETWHDTDSAVLGRLRCAGFNVIDRPRPRAADADNMLVNHGGIVIVAAADVTLSPIVIVDQPTTFEMVCVRAVIGCFVAVVVVVYRPGSMSVQQRFFDELAVVLDRFATHQEPVYIVGDFNVRLDHSNDPHADQFRLLVDCYGLKLHPTGPTHQLGGTLDAVITQETAGCPECVVVEDVGLSDHHLLQWEVSTTHHALLVVTVRTRPWRHLDLELFRSALSTTRLCHSDDWPTDIDEMAALYDIELTGLLDSLIPESEFSRRPRPSDPWFDMECRVAKRITRRLERACAAANRRATTINASSSSNTSAAAAVAAKAAWYDQRRSYRQLRRRKCAEFWSDKMEADHSDPRKLWRSVDVLLGRGRLPANSAIDVESFNRFFVEKVNKVQSTTNGSTPPDFRSVKSGVAFRAFSPLTTDDVISAVRRLPDKFSAADSIPTSVFKQVIDVIAPFIVALFNRSLAVGHFPAGFKDAFLTPIVKKPGLDITDVCSYRPISNLSVLSKLLERLVALQLRDYLTSADLLPSLQSGFRPGHSTETAVLRVLSDILQAVDRGDSAALVLLDLSAAFDTVDHEILLQRLRTTFGIHDTVHQWFQSYLHGRTQYVRRGLIKSSKVRLTCGVPQGSVLGPLLFILYTADLISLIEDNGLSSHLYADDTQVYGSCRPVDIDTFSSKLSECIEVISNWMRSNRLQLNSDKTEILWCATGRRQHQLPTTSLLTDGVPVTPVKTVRNLGIFIDANLVMRTHVQRTVSRCFAALRQLRQIRNSVPAATFQSLVVALVLSRLDYGNSVLTGLPAHLVRRLQSVQNAAARLICNLRRSDHITDALVSLHWLRIPERVVFKIAVLTFKVIHGIAPEYLGPVVRVADLTSRQALRSASTNCLVVPPFKLSTIGNRAFPVAGPQVWNSLPENITSAPSLSIFRKRLKTHLFRRSFPHLIS
jgi:hypothetical protein